MAKTLKAEIKDLKFVIKTPGTEPKDFEFPSALGPDKIGQDVQIGVEIAQLVISYVGKLKIDVFQGEDNKPFVSHQININIEDNN
jgi:hypothetical protein